jgi:hypothetical protein
VFFINLPLAAAVIVVAMWRVPETRSGEQAQRIDWPGIGLTIAGLGAIVFGLVESTPSAVVAGLLLLAAFVRVEARSPAPMLPLQLFTSRAFTGANLLTLFLYAALGGVMFFLPLNLIQVQGYTATAAGAALLPFILLMFLLSRWSGGLIARFGARRPLLIGPLITGFGYLALALAGVGGSYARTLPGVLLLGLGMAISVAPLTTTVMRPWDEPGRIRLVNNAVSRVAARAVAAFGLVMSWSSTGRSTIGWHDRLPAEVRQDIDAQRPSLAGARTDNPEARRAIQESFVAGYRLTLAIAAGLTVLSAASTAAFIEKGRR